jgi:hypothetical protein
LFPDELAEGIEEYMNSNTLHVVYKFMTTYVRRIYLDAVWKRKMERSPNLVFFQMVTARGIVYVISLVKNRKVIVASKEKTEE